MTGHKNLTNKDKSCIMEDKVSSVKGLNNMNFKINKLDHAHFNLSEKGKELILDVYESNVLDSIDENNDLEARAYHKGIAQGVKSTLMLLGFEIKKTDQQSEK